MARNSRKIGDAVRGITRQALTQGKLDRAAVRRASAEARRNLARVERLCMKATLASGALAARVAAGMLAGLADTLAQKLPRRPR